MDALGNWTEVAPWKSRLLLIIDTVTGEQSSTVTGKRQLLESGAPVDLIAVWPGQWSSSARCFGTVEAVEQVAKILA